MSIPVIRECDPITGHSDSITPRFEVTLDKPPSCVEFVPGSKEYFVVGTYQLDSKGADEETDKADVVNEGKEPRRSGSLRLLKVDSSTWELSQISFLECPSAIYDLHFLDGGAIFAASSSTGTIAFYEIIHYSRNESTTPEICHIFTQQVLLTSTIITYFTFIPRMGGPTPLSEDTSHDPCIAISTDDGGVYLMSYDLSAKRIQMLNAGSPIAKHVLKPTGDADYAWCCAFLNGASSVYSGGDNTELIRTQLPISIMKNFEIDEEETAIGTSKVVYRYHDAGVLTIVPLSTSVSDDSAILLTGSYDNHVRIYDTGSRTTLAELELGGGVYRLKILQEYHWPNLRRREFLVLASCMHAGTKLLGIRSEDPVRYDITVVGSLNVSGNTSGIDSDNYCYAAAAKAPGEEIVRIVDHRDRGLKTLEESIVGVSGTFVDKKLTIWSWNPFARKIGESI